MTREAIALVNSAIDQLVLYDSALLGLDVTERSLLYRLAHYIALLLEIVPEKQIGIRQAVQRLEQAAA